VASPRNIFLSLYLSYKFGARFHRRNRNNSEPKLLAAYLPGEQHGVRVLLFVLATHEQGYRLLLLGADIPRAGATRLWLLAWYLSTTRSRGDHTLPAAHY
jgi:hypothetical protein